MDATVQHSTSALHRLQPGTNATGLLQSCTGHAQDRQCTQAASLHPFLALGYAK